MGQRNRIHGKPNTKKQQERRQRELIRAFDQELFSYTGQIAWLLPGLVSFVLLIFLAVPAQEFTGGDSTPVKAAAVFLPWLPWSILQPYLYTTDAFEPWKRTDRTYGKLRHLPASRRQYEAVRMGYLFRFLWKLALAGLAVQCAMAWLVLGEISFLNVLYVATAALAIPMAIGKLILWEDRFAGGCRGSVF